MFWIILWISLRQTFYFSHHYFLLSPYRRNSMYIHSNYELFILNDILLTASALFLSIIRSFYFFSLSDFTFLHCSHQFSDHFISHFILWVSESSHKRHVIPKHGLLNTFAKKIGSKHRLKNNLTRRKVMK